MPNMKKMKNKKGIILLSGGLDSLVSFYLANKKCEIILALTFDYGQKAAADEIKSAKEIAKKFDIPHKTIRLSFLKEETNNSLTNKEKTLDFKEMNQKSADSVWIANRNGLFLNIAGVYADSKDADYIIFGANKEEAENFSDNSAEFIKTANKFFKYSTKKHPKVLAPCKNMEKSEIISIGIKQGVDFSLLKSCYDSSETTGKLHCGKCESCKRLKNAIIKSKNKDLLNLIF